MDTPLARPAHEMRDHYTVVVIGSGYGGAITASRLARAGQSVCLLERGREIRPGSYPRTTEHAGREMQLAHGSRHVGDRRGLYWFTVGDDMNVLSGCGLGGTSLINANVSLRPSDSVLADPHWPEALRGASDTWDRAYGLATEMLRPETYPASYPPLAKVDVLRRSAGGDSCTLTPINVNFRAGVNHVGVHQDACNGCGDCVTGCNYGAKNTLLMNYLPDAVQHGAEIFTEVEVRWVERVGDPWAVRYVPLGTGRGRFEAPPMTVTADIVVVAAGTLGSNGILLRSRERGLAMSERLGERFTGNGDSLGYSYGLDRPVRGVGAGASTPSETSPPGPCIAAVIDDRAQPDPLDRMIIEDAVIPGAIAGAVPMLFAPQLLPRWLRGKLRRGNGPIGMLRSALSRGTRGPIARTETYLLMGHDDASGRVVLRGDEPTVEWPGCGERPFAVRADERLARAAAQAGGEYVKDPIYVKALHHEVITVHPLGGCVMADRAEEGVVDALGRVYRGTSGTAVHEGLYVSDGSVVPVPLGVNPLLTISAIAEHTVARLAADRGWTIDYAFAAPAAGSTAPVAAVAPPSPPHRPGLRFSERMSGGFSLGDQGREDPDPRDVDLYLGAEAAGNATGSHLTFVLTLATDDARALIQHLDLPMTAEGTVEAPTLSPEPLMVRNGVFRLFVADDADPDVRHMHYELPLETVDGRRFHFSGFKTIQAGTSADAWSDTTTLYVTVRQDSPTGPVAGRGVLHISRDDFARQLSTMTTTGPASELERLELLARFGERFAGTLVHHYGHVVQRTSPLKRNAPPRPHRALRVPAPVVHPYRSLDGLDLRLTRYQGGTRGPVVLSHGQGANTYTFATDTVHTNMVEYLVEHGFDVWVQEWRASTQLPTSRGSFTADTVAHCDHPAAEQAVRELTGRHDLHWVTHCVGSITTTMATLAGLMTPASLLFSGVSMHPVSLPVQSRMVRMGIPKLLHIAGVKFLTSDSYDDESLGAKAFDQVLRLFPVYGPERCDQTVCRRLAFIYGNAIHHPAVSEETHLALHELFGVSNLAMMTHLGNCAVRRRIVDAKNQDVYFQRLDFMRLPVTFIHGMHNRVWLPESTQLTYDFLVRELGPEYFRRVTFPDFGQQDTFIGERSADVIFPHILAHLERAGA